LLTALLAAAFSAAATADFAPRHAKGKLSFRVEVVGTGSESPPARSSGWDRREWSHKASANLSIRLQAIDPVPDDSAENKARMADTRAAWDKTFSEKDQDIIEQWEEKIDECDGKEACENRVRAQMMADPAYQRMIRKAQGGGGAVMQAAQAVDTKPQIQLWLSDALDPAPAAGSLSAEAVEKVIGAISETGGKVDVTCKASGKLDIRAGSAESKIGATLRIDAKRGSYEILVPAHRFGLSAIESCADSKSGAHPPGQNKWNLQLTGHHAAKGQNSLDAAFTFRGKLAGSPRSPQLKGRESITTYLKDPGDPRYGRPVKVTIEWQFAAGGR
jgi:hypothetical protein